MPNHVKNTLTVYGEPTDVARFVKTARGKIPPTGDREGVNAKDKIQTVDFCFHKLVTLPQEYSTNPYGDDSPRSGFKLECATWGIKWGAYNIQKPIVEPGIVTYRFETAWDAPTEFLAKAVKNWPTLQFFLSWGGEGPCRGRWQWDRGCTEDRREKYEDWKDQLSDYEGEDEAEEERCGMLDDSATHAHQMAHLHWLASDIAGIENPLVAADWFQDREMVKHAAAMRLPLPEPEVGFVCPLGKWK